MITILTDNASTAHLQNVTNDLFSDSTMYPFSPTIPPSSLVSSSTSRLEQEFNNFTVNHIPMTSNDSGKFLKLSQLEIAPIFLLCCAIHLTAICAFLRSGFILKLFSMILAVLGQITTLHYSDLFIYYNHMYTQNR